MLAGALAAAGFGLTALLRGGIAGLYLTYGVLAGTGIGIAYNVIISTVSGWFPDKKGLCSGCLMMGFGTSALLLGNVADSLIKSALGWRVAYVILGLAIALVMVIAALLLKKPGADTVLPQPKAAKAASADNYERKDFTSAQMLCRPSFWMGFLFLVFLSAVGSSVISFAKDLALSVHASEALAVTLVGVLSVCNGLGRIITGTLYDAIGRANTMRCVSIIAVSAAGMILLAVSIDSLPLCILGLCLTGMSYGSCATTTATFTSLFYGMKYYSTNMAFMTFNAMGGSFIATLSSKVLEASGGYTAPFIMLLAFTIVASILNLFIRKP
jgi:OFA family oxalate/formate antiporter-like MFS transporter